MRRVAITGMGILSPIGNTPEAASRSLAKMTGGIRRMPEWTSVKDLKTLVAGTVEMPDPRQIPRKYRRTMGRVALLGTFAAMAAAKDAGLEEGDLASQRTGLSMGSTTGSTGALEEFYTEYLSTGAIGGIEGTLFMKVMSHTVAANAAATLGVRGRVTAPCSACASSAQAIGEAFEAVRSGVLDLVLCGGAEQVHPTTAAVFDIIAAASRSFNDEPHKTPRPFDADRDGLVVSEGAAVLVLEDMERARARGAAIHGEVLGYASNCGATNLALSDVAGMAACMEGALDSAAIKAAGLDYVNAHATATLLGDATEAEALRQVIGAQVPVSSTKGYTGHMLGACGAAEAIFCVEMIKQGFMAPTLNLETVDPQCGELQHLRKITDARPARVLSNNFGFGGINASLVLGKADDD